jgi:hypothetical protein
VVRVRGAADCARLGRLLLTLAADVSPDAAGGAGEPPVSSAGAAKGELSEEQQQQKEQEQERKRKLLAEQAAAADLRSVALLSLPRFAGLAQVCVIVKLECLFAGLAQVCVWRARVCVRYTARPPAQAAGTAGTAAAAEFDALDLALEERLAQATASFAPADIARRCTARSHCTLPLHAPTARSHCSLPARQCESTAHSEGALLIACRASHPCAAHTPVRRT